MVNFLFESKKVLNKPNSWCSIDIISLGSSIYFLGDSDYLSKFKIYCLVNKNNREEAQLLYDLLKELGFNENSYDEKFNFCNFFLNLSKRGMFIF